ncbi:unnamed protein product, partial [Amoebophrya sp. A25]|eukprot:GSA25T00019526001.1
MSQELIPLAMMQRCIIPITTRPTFLQYMNALPKLSNKTTMAPLFSLL